MRKHSLLFGSALLGLTLVVGAGRSAVAADQADIPSDGIHCYYHLYHCVYDDDGYWSGCLPEYNEGWIPTSTAKAICAKYNRS